MTQGRLYSPSFIRARAEIRPARLEALGITWGTDRDDSSIVIMEGVDWKRAVDAGAIIAGELISGSKETKESL